MEVEDANHHDDEDSDSGSDSEIDIDDEDSEIYSDSDIDSEDDCSDEEDVTPRLDVVTLRALRLDDPYLTALFVYKFHNIDEKEAGRCIGENTHLKKLAIKGEPVARIDDEIDEQHARVFGFLVGIENNRSLEHLVIRSCHLDYGSSETFAKLSPFFEHNTNLHSIEIKDCDIGDAGTRDLASALSKRCNKESLQRINLLGNLAGDDSATELVEVLAGYSNLEDISLKENNIGSKACLALSAMLSNPNSKLKRLVLEDNSLDDDAVTFLADALTKNTTLKALNLASNHCVKPSGWRAFFACLKNPNSAIEELDISLNNISDEGINALGSCLANNKKLIALELNRDTLVLEELPPITPVTANGWQTFFTCLQNSSSTLSEVFLGGNSLGEEGLIALGNLLRNNSTIKIMGLHNCHGTPAGWRTFFSGLGSPNSALTELHLDNNEITDEVITHLARALMINVTLKRVVLCDNPSITRLGWGYMFYALCNKSSIMNIGGSNHTLCHLGEQGTENTRVHQSIPMGLVALLHFNRCPVKWEVGREKILRAHFRANAPNIHLQEFLDMNLKVLPHAMSWIGRDSSWYTHRNTGHPLLYELLRNLPTLFESDKPGAKRKRAFESSLAPGIG